MSPSSLPTTQISDSPTAAPVGIPTVLPSTAISHDPTWQPTSASPTSSPGAQQTTSPVLIVTASPTSKPTSMAASETSSPVVDSEKVIPVSTASPNIGVTTFPSSSITGAPVVSSPPTLSPQTPNPPRRPASASSPRPTIELFELELSEIPTPSPFNEPTMKPTNLSTKQPVPSLSKAGGKKGGKKGDTYFKTGTPNAFKGKGKKSDGYNGTGKKGDVFFFVPKGGGPPYVYEAKGTRHDSYSRIGKKSDVYKAKGAKTQDGYDGVGKKHNDYEAKGTKQDSYNGIGKKHHPFEAKGKKYDGYNGMGKKHNEHAFNGKKTAFNQKGIAPIFHGKKGGNEGSGKKNKTADIVFDNVFVFPNGGQPDTSHEKGQNTISKGVTADVHNGSVSKGFTPAPHGKKAGYHGHSKKSSIVSVGKGGKAEGRAKKNSFYVVGAPSFSGKGFYIPEEENVGKGKSTWTELITSVPYPPTKPPLPSKGN